MPNPAAVQPPRGSAAAFWAEPRPVGFQSAEPRRQLRTRVVDPLRDASRAVFPPANPGSFWSLAYPPGGFEEARCRAVFLLKKNDLSGFAV
jgi:hypothetical protein